MEFDLARYVSGWTGTRPGSCERPLARGIARLMAMCHGMSWLGFAVVTDVDGDWRFTDIDQFETFTSCEAAAAALEARLNAREQALLALDTGWTRVEAAPAALRETTDCVPVMSRLFRRIHPHDSIHVRAYLLDARRGDFIDQLLPLTGLQDAIVDALISLGNDPLHRSPIAPPAAKRSPASRRASQLIDQAR
jgi:hypothetical protein